jgi:hypothetical protein
VIDGEAPGGEAAARTPGDHGRLEVDGFHECVEIRREVLDPIARGRAARVAVASLGQGEYVDRPREMGQHQLERVPGIGDGMQENEWDARRISLLDILDPHPGRKLKRSDRERHVQFLAIRTIFA